MKTTFCVLLLSLIALVSALSSPPRLPRPEHPFPEIRPELIEFINDLKDFFRLYPRSEIRSIVREHWQDEELRSVARFVRTTQFQDVVHAIVATPEFRNIVQYLSEADWPWIYRALADVSDEIETIGKSVGVTEQRGGGLTGLLDDIIAVLPKKQLRALFEEKMRNGSVFARVANIFNSNEMQHLLSAAKESEFIRSRFGILQENGINMSKLMEYKRAMFGF